MRLVDLSGINDNPVAQKLDDIVDISIRRFGNIARHVGKLIRDYGMAFFALLAFGGSSFSLSLYFFMKHGTGLTTVIPISIGLAVYAIALYFYQKFKG